MPDQSGISVLSRKSVTLGFLKAKSQFGDCQNVRYSRKSGISESGTSENLCNYKFCLVKYYHDNGLALLNGVCYSIKFRGFLKWSY